MPLMGLVRAEKGGWFLLTSVPIGPGQRESWAGAKGTLKSQFGKW